MSARLARRARVWASRELLPYQGQRRCGWCGRVAYCKGRTYEHQVCRACFDQGAIRLRRGEGEGAR
jgi:hypothetical protein